MNKYGLVITISGVKFIYGPFDDRKEARLIAKKRLNQSFVRDVQCIIRNKRKPKDIHFQYPTLEVVHIDGRVLGTAEIFPFDIYCS